MQTVALTVKDEGFLALYRGAMPTMLGAIPYEGIKFGTVGILEKLFPLQSNEDGSLPKPSPFRKMVFGGIGGMMAGIMTYPNDTVVGTLFDDGAFFSEVVVCSISIQKHTVAIDLMMQCIFRFTSLTFSHATCLFLIHQRRLLQLQGSRGTTHEFTGYWDCAIKTYRAHGIGRLYNGVTLNVIRMAPNAAVQFGSYELLKQWTAEWF